MKYLTIFDQPKSLSQQQQTFQILTRQNTRALEKTKKIHLSATFYTQTQLT